MLGANKRWAALKCFVSPSAVEIGHCAALAETDTVIVRGMFDSPPPSSLYHLSLQRCGAVLVTR